MGRRIVTEEQQAAGTPPKLDGFFERVLKYIPAEIVGAWIAVTGLVESASGNVSEETVLWLAFAFGVLITPLWIWQQTEEPGRRPAITQMLLATLAFVVWVFAVGQPFELSFNWYDPLLGSLVLIGFTLASGLIIPREG